MKENSIFEASTLVRKLKKINIFFKTIPVIRLYVRLLPNKYNTITDNIRITYEHRN